MDQVDGDLSSVVVYDDIGRCGFHISSTTACSRGTNKIIIYTATAQECASIWPNSHKIQRSPTIQSQNLCRMRGTRPKDQIISSVFCRGQRSPRLRILCVDTTKHRGGKLGYMTVKCSASGFSRPLTFDSSNPRIPLAPRSSRNPVCPLP